MQLGGTSEHCKLARCRIFDGSRDTQNLATAMLVSFLIINFDNRPTSAQYVRSLAVIKGVQQACKAHSFTILDCSSFQLLHLYHLSQCHWGSGMLKSHMERSKTAGPKDKRKRSKAATCRSKLLRVAMTSTWNKNDLAQKWITWIVFTTKHDREWTFTSTELHKTARSFNVLNLHRRHGA